MASEPNYWRLRQGGRPGHPIPLLGGAGGVSYDKKIFTPGQCRDKSSLYNYIKTMIEVRELIIRAVVQEKTVKSEGKTAKTSGKHIASQVENIIKKTKER